MKSIVSEPAVSQDAVEIPTTDVEKFDEPIVENSEPEVSEPILENAKVPEVIDETTVPTSSVKVDEPVSESIVPEQVEAPKISEVSEPLISREAVEAEAPEGIDEEIIPTPSDKVKVSEPEIFEPTVSEHVEESETLVTREINTHEDGITEPIGEIPSLQNIDKPQDSIVSIERPSTVDSDDVSYHNAVEHEHETEYVNPHLVEPPVIIRKVEHTEVEGLAPELPVVSSADLDENISAFNSVPSTAELTDYNTASELTSAAVSSQNILENPRPHNVWLLLIVPTLISQLKSHLRLLVFLLEVPRLKRLSILLLLRQHLLVCQRLPLHYQNFLLLLLRLPLLLQLPLSLLLQAIPLMELWETNQDLRGFSLVSEGYF